MKVFAYMLIFSLLMTTSGSGMAFPETSESLSYDHQPEMAMMMDMEDCHGNAPEDASDNFCMDHCAHLLALGFKYQVFNSESPASVVLDLLLVIPTPEPSLLWRPPTLNS